MTAAGPLELDEAVEALRDRVPEPVRVLLVLGSGLGGLSDDVEDRVEVPFEDVGGLPAAGVSGHAGRFVAGRLKGRAVLVQSGRFHLYEGRSLNVVAAPVRIAAELGAEVLVVTNAAGGISRGLEPGSVVLLDDQINLTFRSPLTGPAQRGEPRFPDMSAPYDPALQEVALQSARARGVRLARGTYAGVTGPSFETPAEIRMLARLGADVVGMSTVPEVLTARARGMRVLGFSLVTNRAAGLGEGALSHEEVMETADRAGRKLGDVVRSVLDVLFD